MTNVVLPEGEWVDLYDATGIVVGVQIDVVNMTPNDVRLASTAAEPVPADDHTPLLFGRAIGQNDDADPGAWAMCVAGGAVDVTET